MALVVERMRTVAEENRLKQDMAYWSGLGPDEWFHHCSICDEPCWHFEETIRQDCQCERECPEG